MPFVTPTIAAADRLSMTTNSSRPLDSENPYAAPHTRGAAPRNSTQERKKRSAFVWSALGSWFAMASLLIAIQTIMILTGDDSSDGREVFIFVFGGPVLAAFFAGVYSVWWWIRTQKVDLRPPRRYHFLSGGLGLILMMVLGGACLTFLIDVLEEAVVETVFIAIDIGSFILAAELCRFVALRFAYENETAPSYDRMPAGEPDD